MTISKRIREARTYRGLTQTELAKRLRTQPVLVRIWEDGHFPRKNLPKVAEALAVPESWLLRGEPELMEGVLQSSEDPGAALLGKLSTALVRKSLSLNQINLLGGMLDECLRLAPTATIEPTGDVQCGAKSVMPSEVQD